MSFSDVLRFAVLAMMVVVVILSALSLLYLAAVAVARIYQRLTGQ